MIASGIIGGVLATCVAVATGIPGSVQEGKVMWKCVTTPVVEAPAELPGEPA